MQDACNTANTAHSQAAMRAHTHVVIGHVVVVVGLRSAFSSEDVAPDVFYTCMPLDVGNAAHSQAAIFLYVYRLWFR